MLSRQPGPPRGILHPQLALDDAEHLRIAPPASLAGWVEHFWSVRWDLAGRAPQVQESLPHPNVHLVVEAGRSAVLGVHSGRFTRVLEGRGRVFGVKFKPGALYPFVRRPVSAFMDRSLALHEVFGGGADALEAQVLGRADAAGMVEVAQRFLCERLPPVDAQVARVGSIVAGIVDDRSLTSVDELARRVGLDKRGLQRLFSRYVGASPKWVINRYRMHEAIAQLQSGRVVAWAALAQELGYFDQAHFISDFKKLVGRTPAEYARVEAAARA